MKPFKSMFVVVVVVVGLAVCGSVQAGTLLFSDNFQSDAAGSWGATTDLDPVIGTDDTGGTWYVSEGVDRNVQVLNDAVPYDPGQGQGTDNYVSVCRATAVGSNTGALWGEGFDVNATVDKTVALYFRFCEPASITNPAAPSIFAFNDTTHARANMAFGVMFQNPSDLATGDVYIYDAVQGISVDTGVDYNAAGAWNNVVINADMAAGTFTVTVGTSTSGTQTWVRTVGLTDRIASFAITSEGKPGYGCWDNVQLYAIPEPGAIVLLTTGLLGLLCYAWRRGK